VTSVPIVRRSHFFVHSNADFRGRGRFKPITLCELFEEEHDRGVAVDRRVAQDLDRVPEFVTNRAYRLGL
jgi:hypothetical protein